ncbi:MAG TPA: hypothetical protein DCM40_45620, partial [Maribacter sp.]|nr:hypothetical protein [Maribacter sp.]
MKQEWKEELIFSFSVDFQVNISITVSLTYFYFFVNIIIRVTFLKKLCFIIIGNQFGNKTVSKGAHEKLTDNELI